MIAPQLLVEPDRSAERARDASRRRKRHHRARGYVSLVRIAAAFAALGAPVMLYVMLISNLTAMNYALAHATADKTALQEETQRLDDRIAQLDSRDRLASIAATLHMHDPHVYAVVAQPLPAKAHVAPTGIAFLGSLFIHTNDSP